MQNIRNAFLAVPTKDCSVSIVKIRLVRLKKFMLSRPGLNVNRGEIC